MTHIISGSVITQPSNVQIIGQPTAGERHVERVYGSKLSVKTQFMNALSKRAKDLMKKGNILDSLNDSQNTSQRATFILNDFEK